MANKQVETQVQRHTGKQVDNRGDCAAVLKCSGKPSGLVGRSSQERLKEPKTKRTLAFLRLLFPAYIQPKMLAPNY